MSDPLQAACDHSRRMLLARRPGRGASPSLLRYLTNDIEQDCNLRETGRHYRVEGDLPLDIMITIPMSEEIYPMVSPALTCNPVVNQVAPGILHANELPSIIGRFA